MAPDASGLEVEYAATGGAGSGSSGVNDDEEQEQGMSVFYY